MYYDNSVKNIEKLFILFLQCPELQKYIIQYIFMLFPIEFRKQFLDGCYVRLEIFRLADQKHFSLHFCLFQHEC